MADADVEAAVLRLERRLQRERIARQESEAIAERGLRELYLRQQELELLEIIATAANGNEDVHSTLAFALREVSRFIGWPLAHAYLRDELDASRLLPTGVWYTEGADAHRQFRLATDNLVLSQGIGLPGRVLASGQPAWVVDVTQDANFPRRALAEQARLRGAFAFPVLIGAEVVAVLEFFASTPEEPRESLLKVMAQVGTQLGRIIERRRSEQRLLEKNLELTRLVAEAQAQREAAEAANRAKSDFLAVTSHEVRTPLNAVLGLTEALKRETLTERQRDLVQGVLDGGAILVRLLNAVLDLSKIEAGKMTLAAAPFDLRAMVETVIRVWGPKADEHGVGLRLDCRGLPARCRLVSDAGKLEQTLANLASNAVKFSPPGGQVTVRLSGEERDERVAVRIEIEDDGPGVAPADRERIFRSFEQGANAREFGGTGLGLAICSGNVALLGGRIGVDAAANGGACFWIEFEAPKSDGPEAAEPLDAVEPELDRALRVLAAEDHPANQKVLEALLQPLGVELTLVGDGEQAVRAVAAESFDLVLMDVNMPIMDGVAALRTIRAMAGPAAAHRIYMLTANAFEEDVRLYTEAGADGVLKKPIDIRELFGALEAAAA